MLWSVEPAQNSAGFLELSLAGNVVGVGPFAIHARRSFTVATGAVTIAATESDDVVGAAVDVSFDTATTSGYVLVSVKLNAAGAGTDVVGKAHVACVGSFGHIARGIV